MVFTLLVAADVHGDKQNLELQFPALPSVPDLEAAVVSTYCQQFPGLRFNLSRIQQYDEVANRWVDLVSGHQIRDFAQLYAFNREAVEVQKPIPPPTRPSKPPLPEAATHDEKCRAVFEELDVNNNRVIVIEEFKRGFRVLNFDFSPQTVQDLFEKAAGPGESQITFPNWQRFAEVYPTMLDSLYFRCRDYWEDFRQKQAIKAAEEELAARKVADEEAKSRYTDAGAETVAQEQRLQHCEAALADTVGAERDAKSGLIDGQRALDGALRERTQLTQDLEMARETDRQRGIATLEAQRELDRADQAHAWQLAENKKNADKERQSRNVSEEAKTEVNRHQRRQQEMDAELRETRARQDEAEQLLRECRAQTEAKANDLNSAELEVQSQVAREKELDLRAKEAAAQAERERLRRDDEDRNLQAAREREQYEYAQFLDSQRAVEEMDKQIAEHQKALEAARDRRKGIEEREAPILEQEVRLRHQREALEEKESRLRNEAGQFHSVRGSAYGASPARGGFPTSVAALRGANPSY